MAVFDNRACGRGGYIGTRTRGQGTDMSEACKVRRGYVTALVYFQIVIGYGGWYDWIEQDEELT